MTPTLTDRNTVGEIARELPSAVRVFEKYNIDYCCGGKLPLAEACQGRGLDSAAMLAELTAAPAPASDRDWNSAPLGDLIDHVIAKHHAFLKSELPRLNAILNKVRQAHGPNHGNILEPLAEVYFALREELESHLMKEEMVLFPIIRRMDEARHSGRPLPPAHCGSVNNPIRVMEHEHDSAGQALAAMRSITSEYALPEGVCNTYRALHAGLQDLESDLHQHIHLENNILFPRAARMEAGF